MIEKAWNGQEALDKFTSSAPNTYDIILMDIMMPVMDGLETCRKNNDSKDTMENYRIVTIQKGKTGIQNGKLLQ